MFGASYPLLDAFWTILYLFIFILWLSVLFRVIWDIFRSHDLSGWGKAAWLLLILIVPLVGVLGYLIVRGGSMHERDLRMAQAQDHALRSYVQGMAGHTSTADELSKLADLKARGVINDAEFEQAKVKILS
jgi:hypothetical protein